MKVSEKGRKFITDREAIRRKVYKDSAGLPTIGIGHLLTKNELSSGKLTIAGKLVSFHNGLTIEQVLSLFAQDLIKYESAVDIALHQELNQNQFDALVSLCYNIGCEAFKNSSLLRAINNRQWEVVPIKWRAWKYSGGRVIKGLINRREMELKLFYMSW